MKKYNSAIGSGILIFLIIVLGGITFLMVCVKAWLGLAIILVITGFIGHILAMTYYVISNRQLKIRSGWVVKITVPVDTIREIAETRNPMSAPASSLDRLEIKYSRSGSVLVSPKDKAGFIAHLLSLNPEIDLLLKGKDLLEAVKKAKMDRERS